MIKKIIQKAIDGGWDDGPYANAFDGMVVGEPGLPSAVADAMNEQRLERNICQIIFNHDFCKAFFGEEHPAEVASYKNPVTKTEINLNMKQSGVAWKYHIQQLALAEDKIKYLEKFL
jgi:hypothetical protein